MLFLGHVACSLLIADATDSDRVAAIAGGLVPDVIDKTAGLLHLAPTRWLAHGLPFLALAALATRAALPEKQSRAFALGCAGHLVCDLWAGGKVPWLAPFEPQRTARRNRWPNTPKKWLVYLLPELVGAMITWRSLGRIEPE